jgi:glycosyltransferase involved in cell wall biosynthesis
MPAICKRLPNALLLIAGHDSWGYGKNLHQLIERLGVHERVRLIGFQTDVISFLHALDVFAFPSKSEGFGQILVEAMAAGKPVVACKIPPMTEIAVDGETGLLVEPGKPQAFGTALVRLLSRPDEQRRMGYGAQKRVYTHFTANRMADEMSLLYEDLVAQKHARQIVRA